MINKLVVLIPAYEPTIKFIDLLKELKKNNLNVVVVNDGSGEEYRNIFSQVKKCAKLIEYDNNCGKGFALKKGFQYIYDNYDKDVSIVTADCDGQHSVKDIIKIGKSCNKNKLLILGRRLRKGKIPLRSRLGNAITRFIFRMSTGVDVYDTQTGLRAFKNNLVPFMNKIDGNRFEYEMNVLLKSIKDKIIIKEIDIETIYVENNSGSHFRAIKDSFKIYMELLKFYKINLSMFLIDYILFLFFIVFTNKLVLSNIISRILSVLLKIRVNGVSKKEFLNYILLSFIILGINIVLLSLFVNILFINVFVAKFLVEVLIIVFYSLLKNKVKFDK